MVNSVIPLNRERKILLICGVVLLLAGAVYRFSPDVPSLFSGSDEMHFKEMELMKYRRVLKDKMRLDTALVSTERELARIEAGLLSQGTPTLAAVDIQNMLSDIAEQKEIMIRSMRSLQSKPAEKGEYITIPVEVNMRGSIRQIKEMLFLIENSSKLLKITAIRIRLPNPLRPEEIHSTFTVEGLMKNMKSEG
jgi:hypothetical protein